MTSITLTRKQNKTQHRKVFFLLLEIWSWISTIFRIENHPMKGRFIYSKASFQVITWPVEQGGSPYGSLLRF